MRAERRLSDRWVREVDSIIRRHRPTAVSRAQGNELVYVGGVGTGFNERSADELREQMDRLIIAKPAVDTGRKRNAVFVRPELVAEIEYRAWTDDGKLRHSSYKGLREVQDNAGICEIE
ncbi:ATP-dependent DNA ligase [Rhizobium leguminosarum]|uniref:ATP dependent DNA ligase n=1 Tax=Rhizobium leguminosarum TaxID=384 RepID=UPI003CCA2798